MRISCPWELRALSRRHSGGGNREQIERADYGRAGTQGGSFERRKGGHAPLGSPMVVEATTKGEPRARFAEALSFLKQYFQDGLRPKKVPNAPPKGNVWHKKVIRNPDNPSHAVLPRRNTRKTNELRHSPEFVTSSSRLSSWRERAWP